MTIAFDQPRAVSRRQLLERAACDFGSLALAGLYADAQAAERQSPLSPKLPHLPSRAKRSVFIFMQGSPSQVDTYDYKPRFANEDGKKVKFKVARTRKVTPKRVFKSLWKFRRYGECGRWVSELFPHLARYVDDYCVICSMHTEGVAHGPATLFLHTGSPISFVRRCCGCSATLCSHNNGIRFSLMESPSDSMQGGERDDKSFTLLAVSRKLVSAAFPVWFRLRRDES